MRDFRLSQNFNDRAGLVSFGEDLGRILKEQNREQPWMIRLDGDFDSGKSLVALAIDKGFRPEAYPEGLHSGIRIETLMPWHRNPPGSLHTVFRHFAHILRISRGAFDCELADFEARNPQARVLIASNLDRSITGNDLEGGLDSNRLDLAIRVLKSGDQYERHVELIARDNGAPYKLQTLT
jgi:hypothetical protein